MTKTSSSRGKNTIPKPLIIAGLVLLNLAIIFTILTLLQQSVDPNASYFNYVKNQDNNESEIIYNHETGIETITNIQGAIATTAGSNLITENGKVVNEIGQVVQNNAAPMTPLSPKLSEPLDPEKIIDGVIKLSADAKGFTPAEFTVVANEPVTVSLSSKGVSSRLLFKDPALAGLELPVPADYTMAKTFSAPAPGVYVFYQDMPGRINHTGKMIVIEKE